MALKNHADWLAAHLKTVPNLAGIVTPHVTRQGNLREEALAHAEKHTKSAFLGIQFAGWIPLGKDSEDYTAELRFECSLVLQTLFLEADGLPDPDEVLRRVVNAIHAWKPSGVTDYDVARRWRVGPGGLLPKDNTFPLVWQFPAMIDEDFFDPIAAPPAG